MNFYFKSLILIQTDLTKNLTLHKKYTSKPTKLDSTILLRKIHKVIQSLSSLSLSVISTAVAAVCPSRGVSCT